MEKLARLSQRDVELLAADPNPANRQDAMLRVAELYTFEPLNSIRASDRAGHRADRAAGGGARDSPAPFGDPKSTPHLDRALARQLAEDVLDVATPILVHSVVLTDEDLVQVIERSSVDHARAVAMRPALNVAVTNALIRTENEVVVVDAHVAANDHPHRLGAAAGDFLDGSRRSAARRGGRRSRRPCRSPSSTWRRW